MLYYLSKVTLEMLYYILTATRFHYYGSNAIFSSSFFAWLKKYIIHKTFIGFMFLSLGAPFTIIGLIYLKYKLVIVQK